MSIEEYAAKVAANWKPLTDRQRDALARVLGNTGGERK